MTNHPGCRLASSTATYLSIHDKALKYLASASKEQRRHSITFCTTHDIARLGTNTLGFKMPIYSNGDTGPAIARSQLDEQLGMCQNRVVLETLSSRGRTPDARSMREALLRNHSC